MGLRWFTTMFSTYKCLSLITVHKDVSERLKTVKPSLYKEVKVILDINKQERHIRGGEATKRKYELAGSRER